jgi:DNA-binding transcriptional ArsR family regulator
MTNILPSTFDRLIDIFGVLADGTRLRILDVLSHGERRVGDLAADLGATQSAVSHQLRLLRGARIVRPRRVGRSIFYSLDDQHVLAIFQEGVRHAQEDRRQAVR